MVAEGVLLEISNKWVSADILAVPVVIVMTLLLATWIDPFLGVLSSPLAQLINAAMGVVLACAVLALTGRIPPALLAVGLFQATLVIANEVKNRVLHNDLVYADIKLIPELAKNSGLVAGFVHFSMLAWLGIILSLLLVTALLIWSFSRLRPLAWYWRSLSAVLAVCGVVAFGVVRGPVEVPSIGWLLPMQITGAQQAGVTGNILLGKVSSSSLKPKANSEAESRFWNDPLVAAKRSAGKTEESARPDIIIVQSESLFEPSQLCEFAETPYLKTMTDDGRNQAQLQVPVFGHRTLQTEFEVLSGFPVSAAPNSLFSYYELVDRPLDGMPRQLTALGYRTIAIHPSLPSFWRRDYALPALGFDQFISGTSFFRSTDYSMYNWVSDDALVRSILAQLDSADEPVMVFAVSIENHGPWGTGRYNKSVAVPEQLDAGAQPELKDYLDRSREADQSLGMLIAALKHRKRPTILVAYGDHLPALERTYASLCFKDGEKPEAHFPPVRVWANFDLPRTLPQKLESYLLGGWLMDAAGLPTRGQFDAARIVGGYEGEGIADADMRRLKKMYADVATNQLFGHKVEESRDGLANIIDDRADAILASMRDGGVELKPHGDEDAKNGSRGRSFPSSDGGPQEISFDLDGRVAQATLRPYLEMKGADCLLNGNATGAIVEMVADGRVLERRRLDANSVQISTLPLSGVRKLVLRSSVPEGSAGCDEVSVYATQLLCYSGDCSRAGDNVRYASTGSLRHDAIPDWKEEGHEVGAALLATDRDRLNYMVKRVRGSFAPYTPVKVTPDNKLFLHPTDQLAWMEFDVQGIERLVLSGNIQPLDSSCSAIPQAGVVGLHVLVDGKEIFSDIVDRNTGREVPITLGGAKTLRINVDQGNGAPWCDWFAVGFTELGIAAGR